VEDTVGHVQEKDISDMVPLQLTNERIRLDHGSLEQVQTNHFPVVSTGNDDPLRAESSTAIE
jgi:hypothetical protein